jgi:DNA segregation ATPase FtsK/SpoIIIE-like protein
MEQLYKKAKALVLQHNKTSAIFLQKKLIIDYARASELLRKLEADGVIKPDSS